MLSRDLSQCRSVLAYTIHVYGINFKSFISYFINNVNNSWYLIYLINQLANYLLANKNLSGLFSWIAGSFLIWIGKSTIFRLFYPVEIYAYSTQMKHADQTFQSRSGPTFLSERSFPGKRVCLSELSSAYSEKCITAPSIRGPFWDTNYCCSLRGY
jgi:hypothetical protein